MEKRLAVCNLCEAICGLELTIEDGRVTGARGNPDDPLSRGHICPKGVAIGDIHADPDRLRRPVRRDRATGEWTEIGWDEALDLVADGFAAGDERARTRRARHLPRQPQRPQPRLDDPRQRPGQGAAHAQHVQRHLGRPAPPPAARAPDVRAPADAARARHRPHVVLPRVRRQPDGLERVPDDGARLPGSAPRAQGARRPDGRLRPAPHRDREGRRRAPLPATGLGSVGAARDGASAVRRRCRRGAVVRPRPRRGRGGGGVLHPGARRAAQRRPGGRDRARSPATSRPRTAAWLTAGSASRRPSSGRSASGRSTCSTCCRATSTARAGRCSPRPPSTSSAPGWSGAAATRAGTPASAGCRRPRASCRWRRSARRSRLPARARSARCSPSPATRSSPRPTAAVSTGRSRAWSSWLPSTSTSTRRPGTPTSSCRRPPRSSATTTT